MNRAVGIGRRIAAVWIALAVVFSMSVITAPISEAEESYGPSAAEADSFTSTNNPDDQVTVTLTDVGFDVYCKHSESYAGMDVRLIPYMGGDRLFITTVQDSDENPLAAGGSWTINYEFTSEGDDPQDPGDDPQDPGDDPQGEGGDPTGEGGDPTGEGDDPASEKIVVPDGMYWVFVYKKDPADERSEYLPYSRGPLIAVEENTATLMTYPDVQATNAAVDKTVTDPALFKKTDMSDMQYLLMKDSDREIDSAEDSAYYKSIADGIVESGDSDYEKARKLFKWVAENFYYDCDANKPNDAGEVRKPFDDPYINLQNQQNGGSGNGNAQDGKVALWCDAYAGVYCALVRSQGIPCRIVNGQHVEPSSEGKHWGAGGNHTWCEVYVNSQWITVDPCSGSYSSYDDGVYKKSPQTIYEYFDMTPEAMCLSHMLEKIGGVWKTIPQVAKPTVKKETTGQVKVAWKKVANATKYEIWYSASKSSGYKLIKVTDDVDTAIISMQQGWWYKVRGIGVNNTRIEGKFSEPTQFKLSIAKVAKPTVKKASSTTVKVSWSKVANATKYEVWYSSKKTSGYKLIKVTGDVSSASIYMKQGWWYKVRGYTFVSGTRVDGAFSDPTQFKLTVAKVAKPAVKKSSGTKVKVTWTKAKNATKYEIWTSKKKSSGYKKTKVTDNVSAATITAPKGTTIYYKVRGYTFVGGDRVNGTFSSPTAYKLK